MFTSGMNATSGSIWTAFEAADRLMLSAANSIASGELDGYVDASMKMSSAKLTFGIAAWLEKEYNSMLGSTFNLLA